MAGNAIPFFEQVNHHFDKASSFTRFEAGLLEQIKACNSVTTSRDAAARYRTDPRTAAYILAIAKVATSYLDRGIFP